MSEQFTPTRAQQIVIRDYMAKVPIGRIERKSGMSRYAIEELVERFEVSVKVAKARKMKKRGRG